MKRFVKWVSIGLVTLVVLAAVLVTIGIQLGERKSQRTVTLPAYPLAVPSDAAAVERGRYLFSIRGCAECHGTDGAGRDVVNDGKGFHVKGPNITAGAGGVVAGYTPADWERTLRHGVKPDGRPVMFMPSEDFSQLTDADTGAIVAYVRSLPPVSGSGAIIELPLMLRLLYGYGAIADAAAKIDHSLPPSAPIVAAATAEYGKYVSFACVGCHGEHLSGGKIPGGPPDWPPAANLTPGAGSAMTRYPDADSFARMLQTGVRPDGSAILVMPFGSLRHMNTTDVRALYAYLKTLPPRSAGGR